MLAARELVLDNVAAAKDLVARVAFNAADEAEYRVDVLAVGDVGDADVAARWALAIQALHAGHAYAAVARARLFTWFAEEVEEIAEADAAVDLGGYSLVGYGLNLGSFHSRIVHAACGRSCAKPCVSWFST